MRWRRASSLTIAALLMALPVAVAGQASAAATAGKIGFVNLKRIERESAMGKDALKQLQEEATKERQDLKALDEEANATRRVLEKLKPEERKTKEQALNEKFEALEQRRADRPKARRAKQDQLSRDVRRKVAQVIDAYAKENGFVAVFHRGRGMLYGDQSIDITDAILKRLDKPVGPSPEAGGPAPKP